MSKKEEMEALKKNLKIKFIEKKCKNNKDNCDIFNDLNEEWKLLDEIDKVIESF